MKAYIIDDDKVSIFLSKHALLSEGFSYDIITFLSAEEALVALLEEIPDREPLIIFLDLNMPDMNGWKFLDQLTPYKEQLLGHCFIYILTSSLDSNDTIKAQEYEWVGGLIHKPLDQLDVQEIKNHFKIENNKNK